MAKAKYKEYIEKMLVDHDGLFAEFSKLHSKYERLGSGAQTEFNEVGKKVVEIAREYEDRLCRQSESGGYGKYTAGLAEKFQNELRKLYPLIDNVGIIVKKPALQPDEADSFDIPQIKL